MPKPSGIIRDKRFLDHTMGSYHVENPQRLEAIHRLLEEQPLPLVEIPARPAEQSELELIHTAEYVDLIRRTAGMELVALDPDTSASAKTWETARLAVGGLFEAADAVLGAKVANAFALVRPPGHHAEAGMARGFCIFNNAALAAEHLIKNRGLQRVLLADWDLHHGNGSQHSFYDRGDVLYFSTHQFPYYPGTGHWRETGEGQGRGFTINIPLPSGKGDGDFFHIYSRILGPIAEQFRPDFIVVSAGFDIYGGDPLGGMDVGREGFGFLAQELLSLASRLCGGRILFTLEGGYSAAGLREGVGEVLKHMCGRAAPTALAAEPSAATLRELAPALGHFKQFWSLD